MDISFNSPLLYFIFISKSDGRESALHSVLKGFVFEEVEVWCGDESLTLAELFETATVYHTLSSERSCGYNIPLELLLAPRQCIDVVIAEKCNTNTNTNPLPMSPSVI
jgi:hypothetical protein